MRIVHVTDTYLPKIGGIEIFVDDLARRQAAAGHDVTVLTSARGKPGLTSDGPLTIVTAARFGGWGSIRDGDHDVVHTHLSVLSPFSTLVAQAAVAAGTPTVNTVHSIWSGRLPLVRAVGALAGWDRWPAVWTAVSEAAATDVRCALPVGHPVHVVPNAVDVSWWRDGRGLSRAAPGRRAPVTLVSVMRLAGRKRPLQLLQVLRRVRDQIPDAIPLRAVIIGEGPLERRMRADLARHGMDDWVSMSGRRSSDEIRELYRVGDVYVAPAHRESFGIAALEARAAGLPVVAMRSGGVGEFVQDGVEGLLCRDDRGMSRALVALVTDSRLREAMASHNATIAPRFDWEAAITAFEGAYTLARACAGARSAPSGRSPCGAPAWPAIGSAGRSG